MIDKNKLIEISLEMDKRVDILNTYACKNSDATRRHEEEKDIFRSDFAVDRDRILYSGSYRRYQGKTQVFSFTNQIDEEMTNRSLHTTYVSQISRTIGKALRLNLDLIEAIALGHDLGHTPFGHDGEKALDKLCVELGIGHFHHNIQSLHIVDSIARKGKGLNLTFQVRDGILSHDGERHDKVLQPQREKTEESINEYIDTKKYTGSVNILPATLEGCVVRICDTIAYIGQDIEDAIRFSIIHREDIPKECTEYLGDTNSKIIDVLVKSVIASSYGKDYICFDDDTSAYLSKLKEFNYQAIYNNDDVKKAKQKIEICMKMLFDKYIRDITIENKESKLYKHFLNQKDKDYLVNFSAYEKVRDFISTMTDRYFNEEIKDYILPWRF